ncbi:MAG: hypothetical protein ACRD0X_08670, partial [Thermoanaerobaculia bacterium]
MRVRVRAGVGAERPRWRTGRWRNLALAALSLVASYALVELLGTSLSAVGVLPRWQDASSFWIYERSDRTVHFDPILGYRLTPIPSRIARITRGEVEYLGVKRGNAQGFPDPNDFAPRRPPGTARRLAVFGDSFTAAQYIERSWPDAVEERLTGRRVELLNLAIGGGGLANWWSILTRFLGPQRYELDGVVFAVYPGDLRRGFSVSEHRGYARHMFGRVPSWDPATWPRTLAEARPYLEGKEDSYILSSELFERARLGEWRPPEPGVQPFVATGARRWLAEARASLRRRRMSEDPARLRLREECADFLARRGLPALVVHVPSREGLLAGAPLPDETAAFARALGATLVDGSEAFRGLSGDEIRAAWLPYDGHWAQAGSDRFAEFMVEIVAG